jgi:hypothetical protein
MASAHPFPHRLIPHLTRHHPLTQPAIKHAQSRRLSLGYPTTPICPDPTCGCRETPKIPSSGEDDPGALGIDRDKPLYGHIPRYREQLIVCTGRRDWPSRIEDAVSAGLGERVAMRQKYGKSLLKRKLDSLFPLPMGPGADEATQPGPEQVNMAAELKAAFGRGGKFCDVG